jgi:ElaB/YqjD/DUF883 family membrane-anchored ribosome-binding protein
MSTIERDLDRNLEDESLGHAEQRGLDDREPQAIERQIDATRADMRATIEALERRWSVDRLVDLTVGRIRERGGEFAGNLTDAATQNPVPLLLTSVGVAWMMLTSRRGTRHEDYSTHARAERTGLRQRMTDVRERAGHAAESAHGAIDSTRETLRHAAESTRGALGSKAESLRDSASRAAAATRDRLAGVREQVSHATEQVGYARQRMDRLLHEQPLMLGAIGLAAGAIIGALLPTTEHEDRWLGDARDRAARSVARKSRALAEKTRARSDSGENAEAYSPPGLGAGGATATGATEKSTSRPH